MASLLQQARDELYQRIVAKRDAGGYVISGFSVEKTYLPYQRLEDFSSQHPQGKVYVIGLATEQPQRLGRTPSAQVDVPVMVGYQRLAEPQDTAGLDTLAEFVEQLQDTARLDFDLEGFAWLRTESLKDENNTPFAFVGLREAGLFEAYFTAYYRTLKS